MHSFTHLCDYKDCDIHLREGLLFNLVLSDCIGSPSINEDNFLLRSTGLSHIPRKTKEVERPLATRDFRRHGKALRLLDAEVPRREDEGSVDTTRRRVERRAWGTKHRPVEGMRSVTEKDNLLQSDR